MTKPDDAVCDWLRKVWSDPDVTLEAICVRAGLAHPISAHRLAKRLGLPPRARGFTLWTEAQTDTLRGLHAKGMSAMEIARVMNEGDPEAPYTRNSIIGRLSRLGLAGNVNRGNIQAAQRAAKAARVPAVKSEPRRTYPTAAAKPKTQEPPKVRVIANAQTFAEPEARPARVETRPDAFTPLPGSNPLPWTERPFRGCAWPVGGDGADLLSCCVRTEEGDKYCEAHKARGYQPAQARKREDQRIGINRSRRAA